MTDGTIDVCGMALDVFGEQSQVIVAVEELSELQKELCKLLRGQYHISDVAEEIADVEIMIMQMKRMLNNWDAVEEWKERKLARLADRIKSFRGEKSPACFEEPLDIPTKNGRMGA